MTQSATRNRALSARLLDDVPAPWEVLFIAAGDYPMSAENRSALRRFAADVMRKLAADQGLVSEVFVQLAEAHHGDAPALLSANGAAWLPSIGLGVWPDRDPPALWTEEEFQNLEPGEQIRTLMYQVLRIGGPKEARLNAREELLGLGCTLEFLIPSAVADGFLDRCKDLLLPPITDTAFRSFALYAPLLEAKSFQNRSAGQLDEFLCGAPVLLRESVEDKGLLLAARTTLTPLVEAAGAVFEKEPEPQWILPD